MSNDESLAKFIIDTLGAALRTSDLLLPVQVCAVSPSGSVVVVEYVDTKDGRSLERRLESMRGGGMVPPIAVLIVDARGICIHVRAIPAGDGALRGMN